MYRLWIDGPRGWGKLFDRFYHVCQRSDLRRGGCFPAKSNTVQYQCALEQLDPQSGVNSLGASLRTRPGQMTLIRSVEGIQGFEPFLQSAVAVVGRVAIGLGQRLWSKEERICGNRRARRQAQSAFDAVRELAKSFALLRRLQELAGRGSPSPAAVDER